MCFVYFNMPAWQKFPSRLMVGPTSSRQTLFCFGPVWSNHIAGKKYPEMGISRTGFMITTSEETPTNTEASVVVHNI